MVFNADIVLPFQLIQFRKMLTAAGFSGLPVGTADAGSEITVVLSTGADFIMANGSFFPSSAHSLMLIYSNSSASVLWRVAD